MTDLVPKFSKKIYMPPKLLKNATERECRALFQSPLIFINSDLTKAFDVAFKLQDIFTKEYVRCCLMDSEFSGHFEDMIAVAKKER